MNRNEYLARLRELLAGMPQDEMNEVLYDYEEHFRIGALDGKTEAAISESLGDVRDVARLYKADFTLGKATEKASTGNLMRAVLAAMGLSFFNLVFVLGPFVGIIGVLIGLFGASVGITVAGVAVMGASLFQGVFPGFINFQGANQTFVFSFSVGIACLGMLFTMGNVWLSKQFYRITLRYLKWNLEIVKNSRRIT